MTGNDAVSFSYPRDLDNFVSNNRHASRKQTTKI